MPLRHFTTSPSSHMIYEQSNHRSGTELDRRGAARGGADRRGHLDRFRHTGLPRPAGRMDARIPLRKSSRTSATTSPIPRCARRRGRAGSSIPRSRRSPTPGIWRSSRSSGAASCTRSSRRTSTGCICAPATRPTSWSKCTATCTRRSACDCGRKGPMQETLDRVRAGEEDPECRDCGGMLKSDTISFGQALVPEVIERALTAAQEADLLLAVGSTLQVYPGRGRGADRQAGRRARRHHQRAADAVRRNRRRGAARPDQRGPAADGPRRRIGQAEQERTKTSCCVFTRYEAASSGSRCSMYRRCGILSRSTSASRTRARITRETIRR